MDSLAVGGSVDNVTDVAAPVGVVGVERNILGHEIQIGAGAAWDLEEALAPPLLAGDLRAALREDGVEPVLESERQVQAQRGNKTGVAHEAEYAGDGAGVVTDRLLPPAGQETQQQLEELLAFGDGPADSERSRTDVIAEVAGRVADLLGPFVESETAWAPIVFRDAKNQVSRSNAIANGVKDASSNAEDSVVIDEHGVVVPESSRRGDALVAVVSDGWGKGRNLGLRGFWRHDDSVSERCWEGLEIGDVS